MRIIVLHFLILCSITSLLGQNAVVKGKVLTTQDSPIEGVNVQVGHKGTSTNSTGTFEIEAPAGEISIIFQHINYFPHTETLWISAGETKTIQIVLEERVETLDQIEIHGEYETKDRSQISVVRLKPHIVKSLPTPFGEFNKILTTLPGVIGQNEFSSTYMVRGGNFDENLVYVNDIPIYRPFLVRSGQQEGLSFINPDLVESVEFSSGGWQPKYGDKLASSLNIGYKKPSRLDASLSFGLLGGTAHFEGITKDKAVSYLVGVRHKRWKYLLNSLETKGKYQPHFTDVQAYFNIDLNKKGNLKKKSISELDLLFSYAYNNYYVAPESRETNIGNIFTEILRLFIAFEGKEVLEYNTYQAGAKFTHQFNSRVRNALIVSAFNTREREYFDIEGGYRLCDIDRQPGSNNYNKCISVRGVGTNYQYGRNKLDANLINVENQLSVMLGNSNKVEFGVGYNHTTIDDFLKEFSFVDSANFLTVNEAISSKNDLSYNQLTAFVQNVQSISEKHVFIYGARMHYHELNNQLLFSPRFQYAFHPQWTSDWVFKLAAGMYKQPPFYREFRDRQGNLYTQSKAQSSMHFIAGIDHNLKIWNRKFKLISEAYYKNFINVVPYDVENVRIRYMPLNPAKAYAMGLDFRLSGEFVPGTESWLSVGVLSTKEDLENDTRKYIRRPTDQRITISTFVEDHFPNDPTMRMNLNLQFGTGLPFGPPNNLAYRNSLKGEYYLRADIGFSKMITLNKSNDRIILNNLWIGLEVLNLLANENVISYTWIKDFNNVQYGIPNTLSARYLNFKLVIR